MFPKLLKGTKKQIMIHYNIYGISKGFEFSIRGLIQKITRAIAKLEKIKSDHVVSFIIVDNQEIHQINKRYRNIDRPTDVISFATIDGNENHELSYQLGDIYISIDKLNEQAISYGHSKKREFAFLVTHGLLHLLGYDHIEEDDEKIMFVKQDQILDLLEIYR